MQAAGRARGVLLAALLAVAGACGGNDAAPADAGAVAVARLTRTRYSPGGTLRHQFVQPVGGGLEPNRVFGGIHRGVDIWRCRALPG